MIVASGWYVYKVNELKPYRFSALNWRDFFVEGGFMFVFFFSLLISV
jgi:hypothetical protein